MTSTNKLRIGLTISSLIVIIGFLIFVIDYTNLSWTNNGNSYLGIIAMILIIIGNIVSIKSDKKQRSKTE